MNIIVKPEFKNLIPPLAAEEKEQLEKNLIAEGCRDPLVLWGEVLIDGHNRFELCTKNNIPFQTVSKSFDTHADARIWIRNNQKGRRNLTTAWLIELELGNKADYIEKGKAIKQVAGKIAGEIGGRGNIKEKVLSTIDKTFSPRIPTAPKIPAPMHNTQKEIAKAAGVSTGTLASAEVVKQKAPELWEKAKNGEVTIGEAYKQIKKEEKKQERIEMIEEQKKAIASGEIQLPDGVYQVVVMDPPWNYGREYDPETSRVANPYPEMSQSDLLQMDVPFDKDCALFLWTTHAFIWDAKQLMDSWGFEYKATLVWNKEKIGMGAWLRMQCEFCLVGIKGKPIWNNTKWRDIITEPRREHSRKPEVFYEMVEDITIGRRLDYFSRQTRNGWEVFGNDISRY